MRITKVLAVLAVIGFVAMMVVYAYYSALAEQEDITKVGEMPERSMVFDRNGTYLGELHGANRVIIPMDGISPLFKDALLAREDTRFYDHGGIDLIGVMRATLRNIKDRRLVQGASTITMQLARVSYDIRQKSLHRKMLEAQLAWRIERNYSKDEILELYMNRVYFGSGLYGIERASNAYFGKGAHEVTLAEAAMLAGIIRGPNRFSPFRHYEDALRERDTVLDRMLKLGYITKEEAASAKAEEVQVLAQGAAGIYQNSYLLSLVRQELESFLETKDTDEGGLKIYVTLDYDLQKAAERAMEERLVAIEARAGYEHQTRAAYDAMVSNLPEGAEKPLPEYLQGALVAIDNDTGAVRALVGGRNFLDTQYNRATMGRRQVGSLFKAFVYASAYQNGLLPLTLVDDGRVMPDEIPWWNGNWSPRNSDGLHLGPQPAEQGLVRSRNTMTVRVGEIAGIDNIWTLAEDMQMKMPEERSPQVYIGNLGSDLRTITSAFTTFAAEGVQAEPFVIDSIQDRSGNYLYLNPIERSQLLSPGTAWMTNQSLQKVMEGSGTGSSARDMGLQGPAGGKTGTTDAYKDAWFVGYNSQLTCGVWVGLDTPAPIHANGYASSVALPIWTDTMLYAQNQKAYASQPFPANLDFTIVEVCKVSGLLADGSCRRNDAAYQINLPYEMIPPGTCDVHGKGSIFTRDKPKKDGKGLFEKLKGIFK